MRYLSVCSGIEAATAAWHPLGWEPVAFSEVDAFPSAVLKHHYPSVPNWGDMTKFQEWPDACICGELGHTVKAAPEARAPMEARRGDAYIDADSRKRDDKRRDACGQRTVIGSEGDMCEQCGGTTVDLLVGGTPCQSFSVAGLRKGLDDPRGSLMLVYLAIARRYRPRWLVWENVPGVLSADGGRAFGSLLGGLAELGYGFAYRVLDAQYFGVAQRRKRVFVVGCLGDWRRAAAVLFERESLSGHPAPRREAGQKPATTLGAGPVSGGRKYGLDADSCESLIPQTVGALCDGAHMGGGSTGRTRTQGASLPCVANPLTARMGKGINTTCDEGQTLIPGPIGGVFDGPTHSVRAEGFDAGEDGTGRGTPIVPVTHALDSYSAGRATEDGTGRGCPLVLVHVADVGMTLTSGGSGARGCMDPVNTDLIAHAFDARQSDVLQYGDQTVPLDTDGSSIGVMTAVAQHMAVRRLTPKECERLQGFPDNWTDVPYRGKPAADGPRYKALGNSMAVPCMSWIGRRIQIVDEMDDGAND